MGKDFIQRHLILFFWAVHYSTEMLPYLSKRCWTDMAALANKHTHNNSSVQSQTVQYIHRHRQFRHSHIYSIVMHHRMLVCHCRLCLLRRMITLPNGAYNYLSVPGICHITLEGEGMFSDPHSCTRGRQRTSLFA